MIRKEKLEFVFFLAFVFLLLIPSVFAEENTILKLILRYDHGSVTLVNAFETSGKMPLTKEDNNGYSYQIMDLNNNVLMDGTFQSPNIFFAEDFNIDGSITGKYIQLEQADFSLVIPNFKSATQISLRNKEERDVALIDISKERRSQITSMTERDRPSWTTKTVVYNGDSAHRLDIVFVGDGYTSSELSSFDSDVLSAINYLTSKEPFATYKNYINFYQVNVVSAESGADDPASGVYKNTALDSSYMWDGATDRLLYANSSKVYAAAALLPQYDQVVVIVNHSKYGGGGGSFSCFAGKNSSAYDIQYHELGHSLFHLADEYFYTSNTYTGSEPTPVNVSIHNKSSMLANRVKWYYLIGQQGVDTYEGAMYYMYGLFRPVPNCEMRALFNSLCPVCNEEGGKIILRYAQ